jgi:hypothetical protein
MDGLPCLGVGASCLSTVSLNSRNVLAAPQTMTQLKVFNP